MTTDAQETKFTDPRNITQGKARVIWADAVTFDDGAEKWPAGCVIPGGWRTPDRFEAPAVAVKMDALMGTA